MPTITPDILLRAWESAWSRPPVEQAIALLAATCPEFSAAELLMLPIGRRDSLLFCIRTMLFGPHFVVLAKCPRCAEQLEFSFDSADVLADEPTSLQSADLEHAGRKYQFRLPTSADVLALQRLPEPDPRRSLVEACLLQSEKANLDSDLVDAVSHAMAEHDPQADLRFDLSCVCCSFEWEELFDIVTFFFSELNAWARRLLGDIHALASVYGWSEKDILAMSPTRRQIYLKMALS